MGWSVIVQHNEFIINIMQSKESPNLNFSILHQLIPQTYFIMLSKDIYPLALVKFRQLIMRLIFIYPPYIWNLCSNAYLVRYYLPWITCKRKVNISTEYNKSISLSLSTSSLSLFISLYIWSLNECQKPPLMSAKPNSLAGNNVSPKRIHIYKHASNHY